MIARYDKVIAVRALAARLPSGIQSMSDMLLPQPSTLQRLVFVRECASVKQFPEDTVCATRWMKLEDKEDFTSEIPASRWDVAFYVCTNDEVPGKVYISRGGFVPDDVLYGFEAQYFRMNPNEARAMDPQCRMMLELAAETAEPCGYSKSKESTSYQEKHDVSCIMGQTSSEYLSASTLHANQRQTGRFTNTGTNTCMLSNRISYTFNFKGASFTVDTACSSVPCCSMECLGPGK